MKKVLIYGKGKTGEAVKSFCENINLESYIVDDNTYNLELLKEVDTVVVSPGIPFFHKIYKDARIHKKEIIGEVEFAYRFLNKKNKIVAITGTDGKSTTTKLTAHFISNRYKTYICGNYGIPFVEIVKQANKEPGIVVIELSSFQIYSIKSFKPDIAVFLNFAKDHLNWHKRLSHYFLSKEKLFKNMNKEGVSLINFDNKCVSKVRTSSRKIYFSTKDKNVPVFIEKNRFRINLGKGLNIEIENKNKKLIGIHNTINTAVSAAVALLIGIKPEEIEKAIDTFEPLPHRLEFIKDIKGIKFYNDSKSTTVQSLENALRSFDRNLIVIMGGINKGGDFSTIKNILSSRAKKVILIGKSKNEIKDMLNNCCKIELVNSMEEAVFKAYSSAETGDVILLSPGCASFDMFKNYEDRGEAFKKAVFKIDG